MLGQEQQFTLILQTLQQLRDVYGDSVDKIVQGNTSNIVFLKSTDDSMLDTLQKMSGTTHKSFMDSKTITRDMEKLWMKNEGKTTYTMTTKEIPVISYNDMAFIAERNSIIFRAGDAPIWNRNETILPMSWRLFKNTITQPGKDYTLQTIPTLSSALDFDVRKNQPDFVEMLNKRMKQAVEAPKAREAYKKAYGYTDYQIQQLDPDVYADEIVTIINSAIIEKSKKVENEDEDYDDMNDIYDYDEESFAADMTDNDEVQNEIQRHEDADRAMNVKKFAGNCLSSGDLNGHGGINHAFDDDIIKAYSECKGDMWQDRLEFKQGPNNGLMSAAGVPFITGSDVNRDVEAINDAAKSDSTRTFADEDVNAGDVKMHSGLRVEDAFIRYLAAKDKWNFARGRFEEAMSRIMMNK